MIERNKAENNRGVKKENLAQEASKGALWGLSSNIAVSAISFVGTAILARILSPKDFGLLGMAGVFTGVVQLFGHLGLGTALVQKKNIDDEYLSTAFWSSLFVSGGLIVVSVILAPFASLFFNEPVIKWVIICLSANFVISSFSSVYKTLLYREIKMKKISLIEISSRFGRVIIIIACALFGMGFWSIVIGIVVEAILKTILFIVTANWIPKFCFSKSKFKELFHYGKNIYGQGFLTYFNQNMDFIVTGRLLGAKLLGFYQFSYNLPYLVKTYIQDGIGPVVFPVFSKVQDDNERLSRGFLNAVKYISLITFPAMFGLSFCAEDFISVVYGARWLPAAGPLKLLCFGAALASVHCVAFCLFNSRGRPDIGFKWNLFRLPITVALVVILSKRGIIGIAWAMFLTEFLTISTAYFATKILDMHFEKYLKTILPAIISSIVMTFLLYFSRRYVISHFNEYIRLMLSTAIGCCAYIAFLKIFYQKEVEGLQDFIKLSMKKI